MVLRNRRFGFGALCYHGYGALPPVRSAERNEPGLRHLHAHHHLVPAEHFHFFRDAALLAGSSQSSTDDDDYSGRQRIELFGLCRTWLGTMGLSEPWRARSG